MVYRTQLTKSLPPHLVTLSNVIYTVHRSKVLSVRNNSVADNAGLSSAVAASQKCEVALNSEKFELIAVEGHPWWMILVPIESA